MPSKSTRVPSLPSSPSQPLPSSPYNIDNRDVSFGLLDLSSAFWTCIMLSPARPSVTRIDESKRLKLGLSIFTALGALANMRYKSTFYLLTYCSDNPIVVKVSDRIVPYSMPLMQLRPHLLSSNNFCPFQSGYRTGHFTETALLEFCLLYTSDAADE